LIDYSIIIPVHNEAEHIERFVEEFLDRLLPAVKGVLREVTLVENGSRDTSLAACRRLEAAHPELVQTFTMPRPSYGEAIKTGMLAAQGSHLSILECDFLDAQFVAASLEFFSEGKSRFIVASKRHPDSVDHRPWKRRLLTEAFNRMLNILLGYPGSDTHGLKSIETNLAKRLCELAQTTDEIFQTELVLLAWKNGVTIDELPIRIDERRATPVSILRRVPMVFDLLSQLRRSLRRFRWHTVDLGGPRDGRLPFVRLTSIDMQSDGRS
jgi:glycosyltransferase involved in cell wall biosynthesis